MSAGRRRIFVSPLDWGLGHASRSITLIRQLCLKGHHVTIGASGSTFALLKSEFPALDFIDFPGYDITYPKTGSMFRHFLFNTPRILKCIAREHYLLKGLIQKFRFDTVISDNRFGLWNKSVYSIFITHQVMIKCPAGVKFLEPLLYKINKKYIRHFDECWIPDVQGEENISGDLSHKFPLPDNAHFIGWLSRFNWISVAAMNPEPNNQYEGLAIISGPEPQRSTFESILISAFRNSQIQVCIVRGTPGIKYPSALPDNIVMLDHASAEQMQALQRNAKFIICRPGYSTLMDLMALKKNAVLIPTPGQTEQEYLAAYLSGKGLFYQCRQDGFNIDAALNGVKKFPGFTNHIPADCIFSLPSGF